MYYERRNEHINQMKIYGWIGYRTETPVTLVRRSTTELYWTISMVNLTLTTTFLPPWIVFDPDNTIQVHLYIILPEQERTRHNFRRKGLVDLNTGAR